VNYDDIKADPVPVCNPPHIPGAARFTEFYRDVLGLPLVEERHGNAPQHWGCELGDAHFAIDPRDGARPPGPIRSRSGSSI
jgi:catechol 2,3-dioxygenase-like lactoylglutathione lyase family enzyme